MVVAVLVLVAVVVGVVRVARRVLRADPAPSLGRGLRLAAAAAAGVAAVALARPAALDSGPWFAVWSLSVPVLLASVPAVVDVWRPAGPVVTGGAAVLVGVYVLMFGLGFGPAFLPAALLLVASAAVAVSSDTRSGPRR